MQALRLTCRQNIQIRNRDLQFSVPGYFSYDNASSRDNLDGESDSCNLQKLSLAQGVTYSGTPKLKTRRCRGAVQTRDPSAVTPSQEALSLMQPQYRRLTKHSIQGPIYEEDKMNYCRL